MAEKEKGKNTFTECNAKFNAFFFAITQNTSWDRDSTRNKRKQLPPTPFIWNKEIVSQLILK